MGKTKVAPKHNHTIPSLELHEYAAVMDEEVFETVKGELEFELDRVTFFTDKKKQYLATLTMKQSGSTFISEIVWTE